jgi:hypothetical protein
MDDVELERILFRVILIFGSRLGRECSENIIVGRFERFYRSHRSLHVILFMAVQLVLEQ